MPRTKKTKSEPNFFQDVYDVVKLIPKGRVTSYGAIAQYLGTKGSARMVGWALSTCPKGVPAHRVVNAAGMLSGKRAFGSPDAMQKLLEKEGVKVLNDRIKHFTDVLWNPMSELGISGSITGKNRPKSGRKPPGKPLKR
jgi:methylated-DNA-protein-cysteine methyltransferase-like protein